MLSGHLQISSHADVIGNDSDNLASLHPRNAAATAANVTFKRQIRPAMFAHAFTSELARTKLALYAQ
jgi:hypothetical protein